MTGTSCPGCRRRPRDTGKYLCVGCWFLLPTPTRRSLARRDTRAYARLRQLHEQLANGVRLAEIEVAA